jgi:PAS domain S-box-containing protein
MQRSEERFRRLFEYNFAVKLMIDPVTGNIIEANKAAEDFYGWSIEELREMRIQEINTQSPEAVKNEMERAISLGSMRLESRHRKADGSIREVEVFSSCIEIAGKNLLYSIIHDISERKRSEEQNVKLEIMDLQIKKNDSLHRMAGAIAHIFNNKLGAVMGNLEMALEALPQGAIPAKFLTAAMLSARQAAAVSGLMRTYLGQALGKHTPLDLAETCRHSLPLLQTMAPKDLFLVNLPAHGPIINADANQIQQVLTNLVTNAWEAVGEELGTVSLTVKTVSQTDIPSLHRFPIDWQSQDLTYACLEVMDTGYGIAREDRDKLFDPFFSSKFTGRGLGLSVVLGIVNAHGGAIAVESELRRGTLIRVFLPVLAEKISLAD